MTSGKQRKSFTLSKQSLSYLEQIKSEAHLDSISAAVEKLIEENRRERQLRIVSDSVSAYCDSLSAREQQRDREWGEFGTSEFLRIVCR